MEGTLEELRRISNCPEGATFSQLGLRKSLALLKRSDTAGNTYEFGGPQVYSFKALLELLLTALNRQRVLIPIPFALAEMQAGLLELLPNPPLTRDQVRLLKTDKVVSGAEPTLGDLGVQPRPLGEFLAVFKVTFS